MVREGVKLVVLAVAAAAMAQLVSPLHGETGRLPAVHDPVLTETLSLAPSASMQALPQASAAVRPPSSESMAAPPAEAAPPVPVRRARIPVGCERVLSGLVRSAAAQQIARCVT